MALNGVIAAMKQRKRKRKKGKRMNELGSPEKKNEVVN
jgi:hypothetical protein